VGKSRSSTTHLSLSVMDSLSALFTPSSGTKSSVNTQAVKATIRKLAKGTQNGVKASETTREAMAALVADLEKVNPTKKLTSSSLIDGDWALLYTTNDGSSAGKLGPFVGTVFQEVDLDSAVYDNVVALGPLTGRLKATWSVESNTQWTVKFQTLVLSLFGIPLKQQELSAVGTWRMTYLDEDFRILYAQGGKNIKKENVYILAK